MIYQMTFEKSKIFLVDGERSEGQLFVKKEKLKAEGSETLQKRVMAAN